MAQRTISSSRPLERGVDMLDQIDYRLAETEDEKDAIYRLRYRAYLQEGAIVSNQEQKVTDRFDDMPNSWNFGVYFDGKLVSSLRISVASLEHPNTPSMAVFPETIGPQLEKGKVIVDPTRFVADPAPHNRFPELPYMTLRLAYVACEHFHADIGLASVRAEHQAFYRRVFMQQLCPPRNYPGLTKPIGLLSIDFPAMRDKVFERYPFLRSTLFERRKMFERSLPRMPKAEAPTKSAFGPPAFLTGAAR